MHDLLNNDLEGGVHRAPSSNLEADPYTGLLPEERYDTVGRMVDEIRCMDQGMDG